MYVHPSYMGIDPEDFVLFISSGHHFDPGALGGSTAEGQLQGERAPRTGFPDREDLHDQSCGLTSFLAPDR